MRDMINTLLSLNDFNWRGSPFQWFFYLAILLTLVFEKRKMVRIVFGWVPFCYLICMFNPLCLKVLNLAGAGAKTDQYFVRLFSFMPLMYVIARGGSLLLMALRRVGNEWVKLLGVAVVCGIICLAGHNVYLEPWLVKADNYAKVPQNTIDIIEAVKDDAPVRIAPIGENTVYIRQIADAITPYGRYMTGFGDMLSLDPPDVPVVMERAGHDDVDYVVVHNTEATLDAFSQNGYLPFALTDNYALFKVEGVSRLRRTLNEKRLVTSVTNIGASGNAQQTQIGYTTIEYQYDRDQHRIKETYLDQSGNHFVFPEGHTSICRSYYLNGKVKTVSYLDGTDRPIMVNGRYKTEYGYDFSGRVVRERYYDTDGNAIGEVGKGLPVEAACLKYITRSDGAQRDANNRIIFDTQREGNAFELVWFQLWDAATDEYLLCFGAKRDPGETEGQYVHELPTGLYRIRFRGHTNLADEYIESLEYLTEGETLYYRYCVDTIQPQHVEVSDLYIGREAPPAR